MKELTREQARRFLLYRHGLLGAGRFKGEEGVLTYVRQVGCLQYDPIDVCGKSHEIALLARIRGFSKSVLDELLYHKRVLIDYFDKNMCILPAEDWPRLSFVRDGFRRHVRGGAEVEKAVARVNELLRDRESLSARELNLRDKTDWYWSAATLGRVALETMYFRGELVIHHKAGTVKRYAPAGRCLPRALLEAPDPFENEAARQRWQVARRIGAVGMLWSAASDAWLGVAGLTAQARKEAFARLEGEGMIFPIRVEGIPRPLYARCEDREAVALCETPFSMGKRARFLAPLDCLLWDRKLIAALFNFTYKWEIYTPADQRRYGYYVLPVLWGERFAGRIEPVCDRREGVLRVKRFWPEEGQRMTDRFVSELRDAAERLRAFHGLQRVVWEKGLMRD